MIDPSLVDEKIEEARARDSTVCEKLKNECARMVVVDQFESGQQTFSLDNLVSTLRPARYTSSGRFNTLPSLNLPPENGSYALQLFSAIMFAVDARAELKLLELIASPHFYAALMRSAAEVKTE